MEFSKRTVVLGAAGFLAAGTVFAATPAMATNSCSSRMETASFSRERVAASCTALNINTKARGELVNSGPLLNQYTQWFSALNITYRSGYSTVGAYTTLEIAPI